eukprot:gene27996-8871_t
MWIMCDPASLPSVVQRMNDPVGTLGSCFMIAAVNYLFTVRAKFGLMQILMWLVLAPCVAQRSPGDIPAWLPVVAIVIPTLARLHGELQARSQFKDHKDQFCLATDSTETTETTETPGTIETTKTTNSTETELPGPVERPACGLLHFSKRYFGFAGSAKEEQSITQSASVVV